VDLLSKTGAKGMQQIEEEWILRLCLLFLLLLILVEEFAERAMIESLN
jgi:hypothetical protein